MLTERIGMVGGEFLKGRPALASRRHELPLLRADRARRRRVDGGGELGAAGGADEGGHARPKILARAAAGTLRRDRLSIWPAPILRRRRIVEAQARRVAARLLPRGGKHRELDLQKGGEGDAAFLKLVAAPRQDLLDRPQTGSRRFDGVEVEGGGIGEAGVKRAGGKHAPGAQRL